MPLGSRRPLSDEKGQVREARGPSPSGTRVPARPSTGVSPQALPAPGDDCEQQGKGKVCIVAVVSLCRLHMGCGPCMRGVQRAPSCPAGLVPPTPKALNTEAQNTGPEPQAAASPVCSAFPHSVQGPGQGASKKPGWEGAATSSTSPEPGPRRSLRVVRRKRKLQVPEVEKGLPAPQSATHREAVPKPHRARPARKGPATSVASASAPGPIERGSVVWYKFMDLPYWPAVVTSVSVREQTARVLLIEADLCRERSSMRVPLRRLKHLDCAEKEKLVRRAGTAYGHSITWCLSLVAHYREGLARGSFPGSFLEYYAADASYPMRRAVQEGPLDLRFPKVNYSDLEDSEEEASPGGWKGPCKRLLPDRMRAARDRANRKLVEFIVKTKGADGHLLDIVRGRKPSRWLMAFFRADGDLVCVETYLEDEDQLDVVARHLQRVYEQTDDAMPALLRVDKVRLVLEVLLPEAMICSIAALEGLDYKEAEEKYLRGPPVHSREKELFDRSVWKARRKRSAARSGLVTAPPVPVP